MPLAPGTRLGPYEIVSTLGSGGMGDVYKALDTRLDRIVAIKLSREEFSGRFEREARAVAALNHPHICALYDVGPNYLVMEYIKGEPLARRIPPADVVRIGIQIADALDAAHRRGIIHRDLKPANILVTDDSGVKVLDFGIASFDDTDAGGPTQSIGLTSPGTAVGTAAYMSPEQARGEKVDTRTDLWSFGVVLYELASGVRPFADGSTALAFDGVLNRTPTPVRERAPGIPIELEIIIGKALEKDRELRYQSAADMRADLKRLERGSGTALTVASAPAAPRRRRRWFAVGAAMLILGVVAFLFFRISAAHPLTVKDTLILADFGNLTGDPLFEGTLREALAVQLEQSPFLKIMDDRQMRSDLGLMGHPVTEKITNASAREICQRENEKATIGGFIGSLGKTYAVTLEAANCQTGETIAREQAVAQDKEHVLRALSTAATAIRRRLGESLSTIQTLDKPLDQVTTNSLEALQSFALGRAAANEGSQLAAVPFFRHAADLDPDFAMAWEWMGIMYRNAGETDLAIGYLTKAYSLLGRVSERERLAIAGRYYRFVTGERDKAIDDFELMAHTYPREAQAPNNLGSLYVSGGDFERALPEFERSAELEPNVTVDYGNLGDMYVLLDRFADAHRAFAKVPAGKADSSVHEYMLQTAEIEGDQAAEKREVDWFAGKPEEYVSLNLQAGNAATLGQLRNAEDFSSRGVAIANERKLPAAAARSEAYAARYEAAAGHCDHARTHALAALGPSRAPGDVFPAEFALAFCGYEAEARRAADQTSQHYATNTIWNTVYLPTIRAALALKFDHPDSAIELLRSAACCDRRYSEAVYLRGLAFLEEHKGAEAAAEFHKILDHKGANWSIFYSLSYLGLAKATNAPRPYQDFLKAWKDADPGLPALLEAR